MRKTQRQTPNRVFFPSLFIAAATLALVPACHELDVTDAELAALEAQAASEESSISIQASPDSFTTLHTFHNWYTGGGRGPEQGTHGLIEPGDCPAGSVVVGVQYFDGGNADWVDGIGMACWGPNVGYWFYNWYSGGGRGSEQGTHGTGAGLCPWGMFVTGVQYFEGAPGDAIDGLAVQCDAPRTRYNWFPDVLTGEQGNRAFGLGSCPSNRYVVGLQAFEGTGGTEDWKDGIGMHCAPRPW